MMDQSLTTIASQLELFVRKRLNGFLSGERVSKKSGSGLLFDQLRDYEYGDDVRNLDWAGYARTGKLFVRTYHEERSVPVTVVVDGSLSMRFGSQELCKGDVAVRAALLSLLAAHHQKFPYQLIIVGDGGEQVVPFGIGAQHMARCMHQLEQMPYRGYAFQDFLENSLAGYLQRPGAVIVLSDFFDARSSEWCQRLLAKHELFVVRVVDPLEIEDPAACLYACDGSGRMARLHAGVQQATLQQKNTQDAFFAAASVAVTTLQTDRDFCEPLVALFSQKGR